MVGCGGFVGAVARYLLSKALAVDGWPVGTLCVNLVGCLLIGLLMSLAQRHQWLSPTAMALLVTGFCGAFTTFSTFANELVTAGTAGHYLTAAAYLAASLAGGLLMVLAGRSLATLM